MEFRRPGLITRIAEPLKGAGQRFALGSLVVAAFALMLLGKADTAFVERLRTQLQDVAAPVLETMARPVGAAKDAIAHLRRLAQLHAENQRLREEVARLRGWHAAARRLEAENAALRGLVGYQGPPRNAFITARVVADGHGPFVKSVLVNAGRRAAVAKGQAAITADGLVGRISSVGVNSARVLLITDLNSRVPVLIEDSRTRAILAGDNSASPRLVFLPENTVVAEGQRIVTSGHGGALPPGIPVGEIARTGEGAPRVRPFVDWDRLEYVQIIDFRAAEPPPASRPGRARGK